MTTNTTIQCKRRKDTLNIKLPMTLDNEAAVNIRDILLKQLKENCIVKLDLSEVEKLSTPFVQTMLAASAFVACKQVKIVLVNPSEEFINAFSDLGLFSELMSWNVE